jgi:GNAT superfamily N-acetyltransferase
MYETVTGYVTGNLMTSLLAAGLTTIVLITVGVPYAVPLGMLVAILDFIPLVGATIAAITDPDYQNHGYGSDAVTELARQLVSEGVIEFDADISPSNLASERLAQHLAQHAPSGIKTLFRNLIRG